MSIKISFRAISGFTALIILMNACRHELLSPVAGNNNNGNPPPTVSCNPDSVYFINDIMPILSSNCTMSGCHDNITHEGDVNLTTYSNITRYVSAGNGAGSKLYKVLNKTGDERMPPPPRQALTASQKALIKKWIDQGARNNNCIGPCDTTLFTYSGAVSPVIRNKCVGCHNPSNPGGNIDLSTYNTVRTVAVNGKLYGSVAQLGGYSPMPKNGVKLSDCEIRQIQKWIQAGSLNN